MNDADTVSNLVILWTQHKWVAVASAMIGLAVRLSKADVPWFPNVPARYRALAAVLLGVAAGILDKVAAGSDWTSAIVGGVFAASFAVTSHDVVIEGFLKGRELGSPPPPPPSNFPKFTSDPDGPILPTDEITKRESRRPPPTIALMVAAALMLSCIGQSERDTTTIVGAQVSADECRKRALSIVDAATSCKQASDELDELATHAPCSGALQGQSFGVHCAKDGGT